MINNSLTLNFAGTNPIELYRTEFISDVGGTPLKCVRGKTSGAYKNFGTFQWSAAVRAVSVLMLDYKIAHLEGDFPAPLVGEDSSLASSLDYAISKETNWLSEMFGCDASGRLLAKRLFHRTNSNRKRPGPVALAINDKLLSPESVRVELGCTELKAVTQLQDLRRLLDRVIAVRDTSSTVGLARAA